MRGIGQDRLWKSLALPLAAVCITSCAVTVNVTPNSGVEQRLRFRSLERAIAQLEIQRFRGKRVRLELLTLADEQTRRFAESYAQARFKESGLDIVPIGDEADLTLTIFAYVLGSDQGEKLVGLPALPTPVGFSLPELAVYKTTQNHGRTRLQVYAFDGQTGQFVEKTRVGVGQARYNQHVILVFLKFTSSDLDEEEE